MDLTRAEIASLERYMLALYELRLAQLGPEGSADAEDRLARLWASSALGEATCVLELRFGVEAAHEMLRDMLRKGETYKGPRTRRMRN